MSRTKSDSFEAPDGTPTSIRAVEDRVRDLRLPEKVNSPKPRGAIIWLPWALCALLSFVTISLAWQTYVSSSGSKGRSAGDAKKSSAAKSDGGETPAPESGTLVLESKGYIVPAHQIQVSPIEVMGRINKIYFEEGQWIEKGTVLAEIDDTSFKADRDEAEAAKKAAFAKWQGMLKSWPEEIVQAEKELAEARELAEKLKREMDRFEKAAKMGGATAPAERDDAKFTWAAQQHRVDRMQSALAVMKGPREYSINAAEAEYLQAVARYDRAAWRWRNCTIKAPVSGNILTKKAEIGNLVSPMSFNVAASLCDMADLTQLEVDLEIQEREIGIVELQQNCTIRCDAYPKRTWDGKVIRIMPVALRAKSAVQVRVRVLNIPKEEAGKFLRPDMGALVSFFAK